MTQLRCERGADIARMIELSETTAEAIRSLDEHWDGAGYPYGLAGDAIPRFGRAGLLHDIGKLGVSNLILDKPGKLDEQEWVQMRRHPALTVEILERVGAFRGLAATAGAHHERLDGGGYHLGLTGDELNRDARISRWPTSTRR